MEMEEINLDELFDLKTILPEIYSNISQPIISNCDHASTNQQMMMRSIINSWDSNCYAPGQEIITNSSCATKLISFDQNSNTLDIVSTNSDTAPAPAPAADCNSNQQLDDEMAKDYYSLTTSQILNFSSSAEDDLQDAANGTISQNKRVVCTTTAGRTMSQARDHLMAERKRRENLGQLFISLSKVVPGLKKLDKASLLEDAINHLKALQEQVSALEEKMSKKNLVVDTSTDDYHSSSNNDSGSESASAEIKARISDRHVLIKILCKKQKGLMSRVPCQMEKIHLTVMDMRIMPFGGEALDITVLAEMQNEFCGTVKDVVDHLRTVFFNPA